jgi:hypothetical protein
MTVTLIHQHDPYLPRHINPDKDLTRVICLHCGQSETLSININLAADQLFAFTDQHLLCPPERHQT